ncbi:MAG: hypothetical protein IKB16_06965 [Lentisphaeria bacterium]|nr:hypothetical protein [Lentisphaeria bacterium]
MAYNENLDRLFQVTPALFEVPDLTNFNFYILRASDRDAGGDIAVTFSAYTDTDKKGYTLRENMMDHSFYVVEDKIFDEYNGVTFKGSNDTITIGATRTSDSAYDYENVILVRSCGIYDGLTSGVRFSSNGVIDFANATGYLHAGENVGLQYSRIYADHENLEVMTNTDLISSSEKIDVSAVIAGGSLTVEGSLHTYLEGGSGVGTFTTLYSYDGARTNEPNTISTLDGKTVSVHSLTSDIRVLGNGLRASSISIENNMSGSVIANVRQQRVRSYNTTIVTGNTFQSVGMLTNSTVGVTGVAKGTGNLTINGIWTGNLSTGVSNIIVGSEIFADNNGGTYYLAKKNIDKYGDGMYTFMTGTATDSKENPLRDKITSMIDPDFVVDTNNSAVTGHSFVAQGMNGSKIEMGGMKDGTTINADVSNITLHGEYMHIGSADGLNRAEYIDGKLTDLTKVDENALHAHQLGREPGYMDPDLFTDENMFADNKVISTAIEASELVVNGSTAGTLNVTVGDLSARREEIIFNYEYVGYREAAGISPRQVNADKTTLTPGNCFYTGRSGDANVTLLGAMYTKKDAEGVPYHYYTLVDRTIERIETAAHAYDVTAYGINTSGNVTINGNFLQTINVSVDYSMVQTSEAIGINASKITVNDGLFMPTVTVGNYADCPDDVAITTMGIDVSTFEGEALGGIFNVHVDFYNNAVFEGAALNVGKFVSTTGDTGGFDIIATIDTDGIAIGGQTSAWNLRIAGDIDANNGVILTVDGGNTTNNVYNDKIELAAGAELYGSLAFQAGFDTLIIDSNARLTGDVEVGNWVTGTMGTLNVIFNLNNQTLREEDHETGGPIMNGNFTVSGTSGQVSPVLYSVNLNDVVLDNGQARTFTLMNNQDAYFVEALKTIELKYDGISLKTLEQGNVVAEIGYYDASGTWVVTDNNLTGYEFRQNNFTARVAYHAGIQDNGAVVGNYIRVYDSANGTEIFKAHADFVSGNVQVIVDVLPDENYQASPFEVGLSNLHEWYDKETRTVTVSWEDDNVDISEVRYIFEYYIITTDGNGNETRTKTITREVLKSSDLNPVTSLQINGIDTNQRIEWRVRQSLGSGIDITGEWYSLDDMVNAPVVNNNNLHLDKTVLSDVSGLDAWINGNGEIEFSWDNSAQTDVSYILEYRVGNDVAGWDLDWTSVDVAGQSQLIERISETIALPVMPQGDKVLQWRVTVVQRNGDETLYSRGVEVESSRHLMADGSENLVASTESYDKDSKVNELTFCWDYTDPEAEYLFEYELNGVTTSLIVSRDKVYNRKTGATFAVSRKTVYGDDGKVYFSFVNSGAANDIDWRVRVYEEVGESFNPENPWQISDSEILTNLGAVAADATDPITNIASKTVTLSFESNNPGKAYRLEYVVETDGVYSNPVAVNFAASDKKYFTHEIKGLAATQNAGNIVWRVTAVNSDGSYEEWSYLNTGMETAFQDIYFCDQPTDAKNSVSTKEQDGASAVVTLAWEPGENITCGLKNYVVEFFQSPDVLEEAAITAYFTNNTNGNGGISNNAYSRLEVTNNQITLSGLKDTQYIYWRVQAVDNFDGTPHKSAWTVGDPFHVYLEDINAPNFNRDPQGTQSWIVREEGGSAMMDAVLTWSPAVDDKAGVKEYAFSYTTSQAADMEYAEYYYSYDNGNTWVKLEYKDGKIYIGHREGVSSYQLKIVNLKNADYNWSLTAIDYQGKASAAKTGKWEADRVAPQFKQQVDEFMVDHPDYTDISVEMAVNESNGIVSLAPVFTWTKAGEYWVKDGDEWIDNGSGSGVESYILTWMDNGKEYSITIDAADLVLNADDQYTWQLDLFELNRQNHITNIANGAYNWKFYAVDFMGNKSQALAGEWTADQFGPVFESTADSRLVVDSDSMLNLISVSVSWDAATDYWYNPMFDTAAGSGVAYYTLTYWKVGSNGERINEISVTVNAEDGLNAYSYSTTLANGTYQFEIIATDKLGNVSGEKLSGTWEGNGNAGSSMFRITDAARFENGVLMGSLTWDAVEVNGVIGEQVPGAAVTRFVISLYDESGTVIGTCQVAAGLTADYSNTVDINGQNAVISYNAATGKYTFEYSHADVGNSCTWNVDAVGTAPGIDGENSLVFNNGIWTGDTVAPDFNMNALSSSIAYTYRTEMSADGIPATTPIANITITINNNAVRDFCVPGEAAAGSGVAQYRIEWGVAGSGIYDSSMTINASAGEYTDCLIIDDGLFTVNYRYRVVAIDYAGNESVYVEGAEIVADKAAPWIEEPDLGDGVVSDRYSTVSGFSGSSEFLTGELEWDAAVDDYKEAGDSAGCGVKSYIVTCSGGGSNETITITGYDFELYRGQEFNGYLIGQNSAGVTTYTQNGKFDNGTLWSLVYTAANGDQAGNYKLTMQLPNSTYTWTLSSVDYAGNTSGKLTDSWVADTLAPVKVNDIESRFGVSETATDKIYAKLVWSYSDDQSLALNENGEYGFVFYDPRTSKDEGTGKNDGSGIKSFTFRYRGENDSTWTVIEIEKGRNASDLNFEITCNNGVYTAHAKSLAVDNYTWEIVATDYVGNVSAKTSGTWNGNEGLSFVTNETDVLYEYNSLDNSRTQTTFTWSKAVHPILSIAKYEIVCGYTDASGEFVTVSTRAVLPGNTTEKDDMLSITVNGDIFSGRNGVYNWKVVAYDSAGNTEELVSDKTITVDSAAPDGQFLNLAYGAALTVDWLIVEEYEHPFYTYTYTVKEIAVTFNLENTFADENGITYEIRTYGKGGSDQEKINMRTFTTTSTTFTLDDKAGQGAGYLMGMANNEVFWDVRAIDSLGNATDWFAGASFKLIDPQHNDADHIIQDTVAPFAPDGLNVYDAVEDGLLSLAWGTVNDAFGMDKYEVAIYDATGKTLLKNIVTNAKDAGLLNLNQNDLANGSYQFAVRALDCSGNYGAYSSRCSFTYDVVRPEFDAESVTCTVTGNTAAFSWDAMTDNLETGKYSILIQRGGVVEINQELTATSFVWENIPYFGTYSYTIMAYDAHGNAAAAVKSGNFVLEGASEANFKWSDRTVGGTVHGGASDTWNIVLDGESADGEYAAAAVTINLQVLGAESGVDLVIRNSNGISIETISINSSSQWSGTFLWNEEKSLSNTYTLEVVAHNGTVDTAYILSASKVDYTESNILDNTFGQARDNAAFRVTLAGNELERNIVDDEWLGFSDDRDFRQITVEADGSYSFDIEGNTVPLTATLWQEIYGQLMVVARGELDNVAMHYGETYYLEIGNADASANLNTNYDVLVTSAAASIALNNDEYRNNMQVLA